MSNSKGFAATIDENGIVNNPEDAYEGGVLTSESTQSNGLLGILGYALNPMNRFPALSRRDAGKVTNEGQNAASWLSYLGYAASGMQGVARLIEPGQTPAYAPYLMTVARLFYNSGSMMRSAVRFATTEPNNRDNPASARDARTSNFYSAASLLVGTGMVGGHFLGTPGFRAIAQGPLFNLTAGLGTYAAQKYNESEKKESENVIARIASELAHQEGISYRDADKIVRACLPHITENEYKYKTWAYGACGVAAAGGLLGLVPIAKEHYSGIYKPLEKALGERVVKSAVDAGGWANGVFYAAWTTYAAMLADGYHSPERRLPRDRDATWKDIHGKGVYEALFAFAGTVLAASAMRRGKTPRMTMAGDIALNKMDVITGITFGTIAVFMNLDNSKGKTSESLLSSPFFSRSFSAGPRLAIGKDTLEYLQKTDPKLPREQVEEFIRKTACDVDNRKAFLDCDPQTAPIEQVRDILETHFYNKIVKDGKVDRVRTNGENEEARAFWQGAHRTWQMREMVAEFKNTLESKVENDGNPKVGLAEIPEEQSKINLQEALQGVVHNSLKKEAGAIGAGLADITQTDSKFVSKIGSVGDLGQKGLGK